jgi:hypothetical protein
MPPSQSPAAGPVIATLVLLGAGSSTTKKVPGRKGRYDFTLTRNAGPGGKSAHVREYTSLEVFHAEQADIALSAVRMVILLRLHEINPAAAAKSAVTGFIRHLAPPLDKIKLATELRDLLQNEIDRLKEVSGAAEPEEKMPEPAADDPKQAGPRTPRENRTMELRRCPEEYVRHLVREEYQIPDVKVLNNMEGMIEAILEFETLRGDFEPKAEGAQTTPSVPPATIGTSEPSNTTALGTLTPEALEQMPIEELKTLAATLNCRGGNRRTMVRDILDKRAK